MTGLLSVNLLFALIWAAITGSFTAMNLVLGFIFGTVILWLLREQIGTKAYFQQGYRVFSLAGLFIYELVLSAFRVATMVLRPNLNLEPSIIAFPLTVDRDFEITLLANLITLTPGTLSVDVSIDRKTLFIHAIDGVDETGIIDDIADGFERKIMEAFR